MKKKINVSLILATTFCFGFYFFIDLFIYAPYQYRFNTLFLFDISSILYSAIQVAKGFPILVYDLTYWGEGAHYLHSFFIKLFGENLFSVKTSYVLAGAFMGIIVLRVFHHITKHLSFSLFLTLSLLGCLSSFAFGYGNGYATYYVFLFAALNLLLGIYYCTAEYSQKKYYLFLLGTLCGLSYCFKYELATVETVALLIFVAYEDMRALDGNGNTPLVANGGIVATGLSFAFIASLCVVSIKFKLFVLALLPIALLLSTICISHFRKLSIQKSLLTKYSIFLFGFMVPLLLLVMKLAHVSNIPFALYKYFPFLYLGEQVEMIQAHGTQMGVLIHLTNFMNVHFLRIEDVMIFTLFLLFAYVFRKRFEQADNNGAFPMVLAGAFLVVLLHFFVDFNEESIVYFLFLNVIIHIYVFLRSTFFNNNVFMFLLILSACTFLICLREPNAIVYYSWYILPPNVALLLYSTFGVCRGTFMVDEDRNEHCSTSLALDKRGIKHFFLIPFLLVTLIYYSTGFFQTHLKNAPYFEKELYRYSPTLQVHFKYNYHIIIEAMKIFFDNNLKKDETIFVFSGIRLPYILADRNAGDTLMPYFLFASEEQDKRLVDYLRENKNNIQFSVVHTLSHDIFSGERLNRNFPRTYSFIMKNYVQKTKIGNYLILERKEDL